MGLKRTIAKREGVITDSNHWCECVCVCVIYTIARNSHWASDTLSLSFPDEPSVIGEHYRLGSEPRH
jgi:hypothetical protein